MNFVTRKTMPRRRFLQAAGASVALPLLDSMVPAFGATRSDRTRLVCIEEVHGLPGCNKWGASQYLFAPATEGRDYELVPLNPLKSLERWRNQFTIISNTDARMAEAFDPPEVGTSMYFDRLAGRPLEVEALTGAIVAAGQRLGIPTPLNGALLTLLRAVNDAAKS